MIVQLVLVAGAGRERRGFLDKGDGDGDLVEARKAPESVVVLEDIDRAVARDTTAAERDRIDHDGVDRAGVTSEGRRGQVAHGCSAGEAAAEG